MMLLVKWLILALCIVVISHVVPGIVVNGFGAAMVAALVMGLINVSIRPLLQMISLPVTFLTLGIFAFVINALMFLLTGAIVSGFHVEGFLPALLGSLLLSLIYAVFDGLIERRDAAAH